MPASRFDALTSEVRDCSHCAAHLPQGARPVLQADPRARILIAGQAPGRKVHASRIPFDDASGERLRAWMGVGRETFYDPRVVAILPMGFCYPGTGKSGDLAPRTECAPLWRQRLLDGLPRITLTLVIGQYALAWHLSPESPVTDAVRDWRTHWPGLLPLPHPSPRNNGWLKRHPWFDAEVVPALQHRVQAVLAGR